VISNADPEVTFGKLIGREYLDPKLARKVDRVRYSVSALSLFFAVDMDLRAAGLDSGNFWFYDHQDVDELYRLGLTDHVLKAEAPPMMFLTVTTLKDPSKMHSGHHTCEAFTFVGYEAFEKYQHPVPGVRMPGYQGLKEDLAWRMFQALEERVPGISQHVTFWNLGTPLTNQHYINVTHGSLYGIEKNVSQVGPGAFSTKTRFDGLYMCGASTLSHGVAGVTATGLAAAGAVLGCRTSDLLVQNGPPLEVYPSEDTSVWPEYLRKQIERGKKKSEQ
jgi:phytoene dehydrogenase-like protein